jgi:1,4-dihydroxy-2-naphthoate octaprenyltransferase
MNQPTSSPTGLKLWVAGARPRTLSAAIVPVAVGIAVGHGPDTEWWRAGAALVVALALQIAVNFANDYSDGVRGTDGAERVGPLRLVGSGLVAPSTVKLAATLSFGVAGVVGTMLALVVGPELFVVGAASLVAGWTYTGGPRPYGYLGLGEVFVFIFFGIVATVGTTYVLIEQISAVSLGASVAVGLWATALLVINNLRDIPGDTIAGKQTLAVRIGEKRTRLTYVLMQESALTVAVVLTVFSDRWAVAALIGVPFVVQGIRAVARGATGADLIEVLGLTGKAQLVCGLAMAAGIALSG